ncbi:MAG: TorF family putative porin [Pseudomonadota bacterium]
MKKRLKILSLAAMVGVGFGGAGHAQESFAGGEFSGNIALTSDYVFRGFTQTDGAPTVQGGFDWASDSFYVGTWASGVDFADGTSTEIDIYGGYTTSVGVVDLDLGAIYYLYPDAPDEPEQNFIEVYAGGSTTVADTVDLGLSFAFSPEYYLETGSTLYTNASAGIPLGENFGADVSLGFLSFFDDDDCMDCDYLDYSIGVTTSAAGFDFDLRFIGSDGDGVDGLDGDGGPAGERFVISVGRSL